MRITHHIACVYDRQAAIDAASDLKNQLEGRFTVVPISNVLIILALCLVAVDLGAVEYVQEDPRSRISHSHTTA